MEPFRAERPGRYPAQAPQASAEADPGLTGRLEGA
jgi:hypothetical protein